MKLLALLAAALFAGAVCAGGDGPSGLRGPLEESDGRVSLEDAPSKDPADLDDIYGSVISSDEPFNEEDPQPASLSLQGGDGTADIEESDLMIPAEVPHERSKVKIVSRNEQWMIHFDKVPAVNPILGPIPSSSFICPIRREPVRWEEKDVFNPAAVVKDNKVYILYRAEDTVGALAGTSRIGLASSVDGFNFNNRLAAPVLFPDTDRFSRFEWEGGCEDPRVVEAPDGSYIMTYTSYDGVARLCIASSKDLVTWVKHGPAFAKAHKNTFLNAWTKSGSIVVEPQPDGRLVAVKINGTYWMYWGEHEIHLAVSTDLINWEPVMGNLKAPYRGRPDWAPSVDTLKPLSVLKPRVGKFDSVLVEPGPPAILREDGILFIYNSKSAPCYGYHPDTCPKHIADAASPPGTYSAGQALFSRSDPRVLLERSSESFFKPTEPYEITGQVGNVCFLQGLVYFRGKWLVYYGTADSKIAVAEATDYSYTGIANNRYVSDDEVVETEDPEESDEELFEDLDEEDLSDLSKEERELALRERIFRKIRQRLNIREAKKKRGKRLKVQIDDKEADSLESWDESAEF